MMSDPTRVEIAYGSARRPLPGQHRCGDRAVVAPAQGGTMLAVIDGLGHGPEAAHAADTAADSLLAGAGAGTPTLELMRDCHRALRRTRGAAVAVAMVAAANLEWLSVGNVSGALVSRASRAVNRLPNRGGIVGLRLPRLQSAVASFEAGDLLVGYTDGMADTVVADVFPTADLPALATSLLDRHAQERDDALVLVARCGRPR